MLRKIRILKERKDIPPLSKESKIIPIGRIF